MTLFSITLTVMLIRVLGQAAGGEIASGDVVALIGFAELNYLPVILIVTGFVSVLLVVTRSYQDSEMVVWFASGLSLTKWIRPVLMFGLPIIILTSLLGFYVTPWANRQSAEFRDRFEKRNDVSKVAPGSFQESASSNRVFFVEGISGDTSSMKNIFVHSLSTDRTTLVVSKGGTIELESSGDKFLILMDGMRYEMTHDKADIQITHFERYKLLVGEDSQAVRSDKSAKASPTMDLLNNPTRINMGEFLWRMGLPFMSVLLLLLAIPLGFVNPRAGRSANLLIALLLYVTYNNMVSFLQASVAQGKATFAIAWWPMHCAVALITLALFLMRLNVNSRFHPAVIWSSIRHRKVIDQEPSA